MTRLSDRAAEAIEGERAVVAGRLEELREQAARMRELTNELDVEVERNARLLRQMDEMLGLAPQLSLEWMHGELRGRQLQEIAVQLLREKKGIGAVVHYRDWYGLLVDAGGRVAGKNPVATFLTQVARAPNVESVKPRSGLYRLRAA